MRSGSDVLLMCPGGGGGGGVQRVTMRLCMHQITEEKRLLYSLVLWFPCLFPVPLSVVPLIIQSATVMGEVSSSDA